MMLNLRTINRFEIAGRGRAHVVHVGEALVQPGQEVILDSIVRTVTGVEWPVRDGNIAILVKPMTWSQTRTAAAIDGIIAVLQDNGRSGISPGTDLRPIAERIYQFAGRRIMDAWKAEMSEANR